MGILIADRWFSRKRIDNDITLLWEPYAVPLLRCNIWHIKGRERDLLIDTGLGVCSLKKAAEDLFSKDILAVATHTHYDHIGGLHEFHHCAVHRLETDGLTRPERSPLLRENIPANELKSILEAGYTIDQNELITAYPDGGFDIRHFQVKSSKPCWLLDDGDIIDTGDRHFQVLHLPGHSPGSIALWEARTGTLFSGDIVYDGPLLHDIPGSNLVDYLTSMESLRKLDVRVVHGGHGASFEAGRLHQIIEAFLAKHS